MRETLRRARREAGLTQAQVANAVKMSRANYTKLELGRQNPTLRHARAIATLLRKPVEELFSDPHDTQATA